MHADPRFVLAHGESSIGLTLGDSGSRKTGWTACLTISLEFKLGTSGQVRDEMTGAEGILCIQRHLGRLPGNESSFHFI